MFGGKKKEPTPQKKKERERASSSDLDSDYASPKHIKVMAPPKKDLNSLLESQSFGDHTLISSNDDSESTDSDNRKKKSKK